MRETIAGYIAGDKTMEVYSSEQKWIRKIKRWAEQYPEDVVIKVVCRVDGGVTADIPSEWFKISPKRRLNLSEEQRLAASERLRNWRQKPLLSSESEERNVVDGSDGTQ
jgi:hypothetical protein